MPAETPPAPPPQPVLGSCDAGAAEPGATTPSTSTPQVLPPHAASAQASQAQASPPHAAQAHASAPPPSAPPPAAATETTPPSLQTSDPFASFSAELQDLRAGGLLRTLRDLDGPPGPYVRLSGARVLCLSSNNYLGLATHPALTAAAHAALEAYGTAAASSRLIAGNLGPHRQLEEELAAFHATEAALLFGSGYHANVGLLQALAQRGDTIYSDELNHASIVDGCRLSRAAVHIYRHADPEDLRRLLFAEPAPPRRRIVVTESLFSMDGDLAPLSAIHAICREFGALLVVDEAHAVGTLGPSGRGACALLGVQPDVIVGTCSKALGSFGGYVATSRLLRDLLLNRARTAIFSTALPPHVVAATRAALNLVQSPLGSELRASLTHAAELLGQGIAALTSSHPTLQRAALAALGGTGSAQQALTPAPDPHPPARQAAASAPRFLHIQPLVIGPPDTTMRLTEALLRRGVFVQGIRPPTVPAGTCRLRFSLCALHTPDDIHTALRALEAALPEVLA